MLITLWPWVVHRVVYRGRERNLRVVVLYAERLTMGTTTPRSNSSQHGHAFRSTGAHHHNGSFRLYDFRNLQRPPHRNDIVCITPYLSMEERGAQIRRCCPCYSIRIVTHQSMSDSI
jgi:hypothetical protein